MTFPWSASLWYSIQNDKGAPFFQFYLFFFFFTEDTIGDTAAMLTGYPLEITLTAANSAAQAWYGYDQVSKSFPLSVT